MNPSSWCGPARPAQQWGTPLRLYFSALTGHPLRSGAVPSRHPITSPDDPFDDHRFPHRHPAATAADGAVLRTAGTKASTRTTGFIAYPGVLVAIVVTAVLVGDGGAENGADLFDARQATECITYLTIGYLVARGLAESGSREYYTA